MKRLKSIGVGSIFRVSAVLGAVAGFLVGIALAIAALTERRYLEAIFTFILAPFLYGLIGAVVNAFMAWIYNKVAARLGGIEVTLEE